MTKQRVSFIFRCVLMPLGFIVLCTGCSGYRMRYNKNPFAHYGVRSVSVPMFLNQSSLADVAYPMTKEITLLLSHYKGLKVKPGSWKGSDAVLLGIVSSPKKLSETVQTTQDQKSTDVAREATSPRADFSVPNTSLLSLNLKLILIRNPSDIEINLIQSSLGEAIENINPKILFTKNILLKRSFAREIFNRTATTDGVYVNMTQNIGERKRTVLFMSQTAAQNFKELILDAY